MKSTCYFKKFSLIRSRELSKKRTKQTNPLMREQKHSETKRGKNLWPKHLLSPMMDTVAVDSVSLAGSLGAEVC